MCLLKTHRHGRLREEGTGGVQRDVSNVIGDGGGS